MSTQITSSVPARPAEDSELTAAWTFAGTELRLESSAGSLDHWINVIETAVTALENGALGKELKEDALRAAHMLAGSLETFGFLSASDAARELESELAHASPAGASVLLELVRRVQTVCGGLWSFAPRPLVRKAHWTFDLRP